MGDVGERFADGSRPACAFFPKRTVPAPHLRDWQGGALLLAMQLMRGGSLRSALLHAERRQEFGWWRRRVAAGCCSLACAAAGESCSIHFCRSIYRNAVISLCAKPAAAARGLMLIVGVPREPCALGASV
jgi:hypothetical protein